jgi:hypothetical protein
MKLEINYGIYLFPGITSTMFLANLVSWCLFPPILRSPDPGQHLGMPGTGFPFLGQFFHLVGHPFSSP